MKKAAIITLYGEYNFGNKLQNYALQQVLKKFELDVDTLVFYVPGDGKLKKKRGYFSHKNIVQKIHISTLKRKVKKLIYKKQYQQVNSDREHIFIDFSTRFLQVRRICTEQEMANLNKEYDYFIIGSDQVWNPDYINSFQISFAEFADQEKRISYAASIGVDQIAPEFEDEFKQGLQGLCAVSVREEKAKYLLKKQFDIDSQVLADPTILLKREEWEELVKQGKYELEEGKTAVLYFLGGNTRYPKKEFNKLCTKQGWELMDLSNPEGKGYLSGPAEFLSMIKNAPMVITDSFHGTVFSILFHTPFVVFPRDNKVTGMYQRIEQLLKWFKLEDRAYHRNRRLDFYRNCNFEMVEERQKKLTEDSEGFLRKELR